MNPIFILFLICAGCYLIGGLGGIVALVRASKNADVFSKKFCAVGFVLQTCALGYLWIKTGRIPTSNAYELAESLSWVMACAYLVFTLFFSVKFFGIFISLASGFFAGLPMLCPYFSERIWQAQSAVITPVKIHACFALLGCAMLLICAIFSAMQILQTRALKNKTNGEFSKGLLPLPSLERLSKNWLAFATLAMLISIIFGILAVFEIENSAAYFVKFTLGVILFAAMLALTIFSKSQRCTPRVFARLSIVLFAFSILIFAVIEYSRYIL